jgi:predicted MPP superfamily phosphohydrolase
MRLCKVLALTVICTVFVFLTWSIGIEPNLLSVHSFDVKLNHWQPNLNGLKIAVISDLHAGGLFIDKNKVARIVEETNAAAPDLIVLTGDFVNNYGNECHLPPEIFAKILAGLKAPCGVYAILGNHDWDYGGERVRSAFIANNIPVLENASIPLTYNGRDFWLTGIEDLWTRRPDVQKALSTVPQNASDVLLTHNPDVFPEVPARVALTIAGHTHGGQVWLPLARLILPKIDDRYGYNRDIINQNDHTLFVSVGIGTSLFPIRFLNAPEISLLRLSSH